MYSSSSLTPPIYYSIPLSQYTSPPTYQSLLFEEKLPYDVRYERHKYYNNIFYPYNKYEQEQEYQTIQKQQSQTQSKELQRDIRSLCYLLKEHLLFLQEIRRVSDNFSSMNPNVLSIFNLFEQDEYVTIISLITLQYIDSFKFKETFQMYSQEENIRICDIQLLFSFLNNFQQNKKIGYTQFYKLLTRASTKWAQFEEINIKDLRSKEYKPNEQEISCAMQIISLNLRMEAQLEYLRQRMERQCCHFAQLFIVIDTDEDGWIKPHEIEEFLKSQDILVTIQESYLLVRELDITHRGQIDLRQFCTLFQRKSDAHYE